MRTVHALGALLVLVLVAPAGTLAAPSPAPLEGSDTGPGWTSIRVMMRGGSVRAGAESVGHGFPVEHHVSVMTPEGDFLTGVTSGRLVGKSGSFVQVEPYRINTFSKPKHYDDESNYARFTVHGYHGELVFLLWAVGEVRSWTWRIEGPDNLTILGVDHGPSAIMKRLSLGHFDGGPQAHALVAGIGAGAAKGSTYTLDVKDSLITIFEMDQRRTPLGVYNLTIDGPDGRESCSCWFTDLGGPERRGPGTYRFEATGAGLRNAYEGEVWLIAVDARLPPGG